MADRACPLCKPSRPLRPVDPAIAPVLLRCGGCNGIWAHADSAQDARQRYGHRHPLMVERSAATVCRRCRLRPSDDRCGSCGAGQAIACLDCGKPMARVRAQTIIVDLCRPCRSTWLDAGELALLARWAEAPSTVLPAARPRDSSVGPLAEAVLDPGMELVVRGGAEAAGHLPGVVEAAGEGVVGAVEVAGTVVVKVVAGAGELAVETVGSLLAGLFDGL